MPAAPSSARVAAALPGRRWFAGKDRAIAAVESVDGAEAGPGALALVDVRYADGGAERYLLAGAAADPLADEPGVWPALARLIAEGGETAGAAGVFAGRPAAPLDSPLPEVGRPLGLDQSNESTVLGEQLLLKAFRLVWPGPNPDVEIGERLTAAGSAVVPPCHGTLRYVPHGGGEPSDLALLTAYVPAAVSGWRALAGEVRAWLAGAPPAGDGLAGRIGALTAELHAALAACDGPGFGARVAGIADVAAWERAAAADLEAAAALDPAALDPLRGRVEASLAGAFDSGAGLELTRIHGDYHPAQLLVSEAGLHVVDFEGEPTRPAAERRGLDTPLRDVASMLRALDNTARWTAREDGVAQDAVARWTIEARRAFLEAYAASRPVEPRLLAALELHKAVYELVYAARFLPWWREVAEPALRDLLDVRG